MAINKKLIHFQKKATFITQKLSTNDANTSYQVGPTGTSVSGSPDIKYQSIVFIKDTKEIWTHGQLYHCPYSKDELDKMFENVTPTKENIEKVLTGEITSHTHDTLYAKKDHSHNYAGSTTAGGPANSVKSELVLTIESGETEDLDQYTFNGSETKYLDIVAGDNIKLEVNQNSLTINSYDYPDATTTSSGLMSSSDKSKLDGIESGAQKNTVTSVAGKTGVVTLTKSDIGLSNVDNTSDVNKPVSTAQATAIADAKKAGTDASAALNEYISSNDEYVKDLNDALESHKENNDRKHIPSGGSEGQVLIYDSPGNAKWGNISTGGSTEMTDAYGVEWTKGQSSPTLTRIGNLSLHKTLPIQSKLKGCVATVDGEIKYWLRENGWMLKANDSDNVYVPFTSISFPTSNNVSTILIPKNTPNCDVGRNVVLFNDDGSTSYGFGWIKAITSTTTNYRILVNWLSTVRANIGQDSSSDPVTGNLVLGSNLSGKDGVVKVYVPEFYIKSRTVGNKNQVLISENKIDDSWIKQPACLVDAYHCTLFRGKSGLPDANIYTDNLRPYSLVSVSHNLSSEYIGGVFNSSSSVTNTDDIDTDLGKPISGLSLDNGRKYAEGTYVNPNRIKGAGDKIVTNGYQIASYEWDHRPIAGTKCTLTICAKVGSKHTSIGLFQNEGNTQITGSFTSKTEATQSWEFTVQDFASGKQNIAFYRFPNDTVEDTDTYIKWAVVTVGDKVVDAWIPSSTEANSTNCGNNIHLITYKEWKNIFYWLYVIEYGTFELKQVYDNTLTSEGYKKGGICVRGFPSMFKDEMGTNTTYKNCDSPYAYTGITNQYGNNSIGRSFRVSSGERLPINRYRGFEDIGMEYGTMIDGVLTNDGKIYINDNDDQSNNSSNTTDLTLLGDIELSEDNYTIVEFEITDSANILPCTTSNKANYTTSTHKCSLLEVYSIDTGVGPYGFVMQRGGRYIYDDTGLASMYIIPHDEPDEWYYGFRTVVNIDPIENV